MAETDSEPLDVEKQASAIAHEFFWCIAGRHQACVEQLQNISGRSAGFRMVESVF